LDKSKIKYVKPTAAWYVFINFDNYKDKLNINSSYELSEYFLDKFGIVSVAGECFNYPGLNLRLSLVDININELDNYDIAFSHMIEGFNIMVDHLNSI
jgi:aspartate/methionine/tyrosine aminotransferase